MARKQLDFFAPAQESDLFGDDYEAPVFRPDPERVRERLHKILAEARAAQRFPWDTRRISLYQTIFPQMTGCLPEDEGAQLRLEFDTEIARLARAA
jgi:hypothetical protein